MPRIATQSQFQRAQKPSFCYLCGDPLSNGTSLNDDHCPPEGMFSALDRVNYPIKIRVHEDCNHKWHIEDEKMAIFYDVLHGGKKVEKPGLLKKLTFIDIENDQGRYQGITNFPIRPLTVRIMRCAHALLYGEYLPTATQHHIHYPIPEADPQNGNRPRPQLLQTYAFANELCIAQKTSTFDSLVAYNGKFRYICTWSKMDNGQPICIFALDIYRLSNFAVKVEQYPQAVIGFYSVESTPSRGTRCSDLRFENTDDEILYPILEA